MDHLDPVDTPNPAPSSAKAKDPVCGMDVNPATARFKTLHNGKEYFFCSSSCLAKFQANPEQILACPPKPMGSGLVSVGTPALIMPTLSMPVAAPNASAPSRPEKDTRAYVCPM